MDDYTGLIGKVTTIEASISDTVSYHIIAEPIVLQTMESGLYLPSTVGNELYDGSYNIIPTIDGLVLPTSQKTMADDLTVEAIPYFETSNLSGGYTVYIAGDLNG